MNKLIELVDRYLVPIYKKDGWLPVAVFLVIVSVMVCAAVYYGYGEIVARLLGE